MLFANRLTLASGNPTAMKKARGDFPHGPIQAEDRLVMSGLEVQPQRHLDLSGGSGSVRLRESALNHPEKWVVD